MQVTPKQKRELRIKRHRRVRSRVSGTASIPRVSVYRSLTAVYAQLIDDDTKKTIVSVVSNRVKSKADAGERTGKIAESYRAGLAFAEAAVAKGVKRVVFDRGGFSYHGRVAAFADGCRAGGLQF